MKAGYYRGSPPSPGWPSLTSWFRGQLDRHLRRTRAVYLSRGDALGGGAACAIGVLPIQGVVEGLHLVIEGDLDEEAVVAGAPDAPSVFMALAPIALNRTVREGHRHPRSNALEPRRRSQSIPLTDRARAAERE